MRNVVGNGDGMREVSLPCFLCVLCAVGLCLEESQIERNIGSNKLGMCEWFGLKLVIFT